MNICVNQLGSFKVGMKRKFWSLFLPWRDVFLSATAS